LFDVVRLPDGRWLRSRRISPHTSVCRGCFLLDPSSFSCTRLSILKGGTEANIYGLGWPEPLACADIVAGGGHFIWEITGTPSEAEQADYRNRLEVERLAFKLN